MKHFLLGLICLASATKLLGFQLEEGSYKIVGNNSRYPSQLNLKFKGSSLEITYGSSERSILDLSSHETWDSSPISEFYWDIQAIYHPPVNLICDANYPWDPCNVNWNVSQSLTCTRRQGPMRVSAEGKRAFYLRWELRMPKRHSIVYTAKPCDSLFYSPVLEIEKYEKINL